MIKNHAKYRVKGQKDTIRKKQIIYNYFKKSRIKIISDDRTRQNRGTIKTKYIIQYVIIQQKNNRDIQQFKIFQDAHNHEYTYNPNTSTSTRALDKIKDFKKLIKNHQKAGIPAKSIYNTLKLKNPKTSVTIRDITNERARAKFEKLKKDSPITAFFKSLNRKFND